MCINLVLINELYYDARPNKSQNFRRYIPFISFNKIKKLCINLVLIKELYYDARPNKSQDFRRYFPLISFYKIWKKMCIKLVLIKESARNSYFLPQPKLLRCHFLLKCVEWQIGCFFSWPFVTIFFQLSWFVWFTWKITLKKKMIDWLGGWGVGREREWLTVKLCLLVVVPSLLHCRSLFLCRRLDKITSLKSVRFMYTNLILSLN
jgi:hypothetical protein